MRYSSFSSLLVAALLLQGCDLPDQQVVAAEADPAQTQASTQASTQAEAPPGGEEGKAPWFDTVENGNAGSALHKSPADDRSYRYLELENGMQVLLISDPDADKAAASLSIDIGSFENPADREGLAHFLEHMLFLGTDKFPEPGEYQAFLTEHGGTFNAYTSLEETNYFFDIDPEYLTQTLDRFSRFFVAPLFNEGYVDRERHAVDSEYQLKIKDDSRREWDVLRELANPEHPFALFAVGNLETLANTEENPVREDLLDFYKKYYTASRMNLVVLGNEPLDELSSIVTERFSPVPTHELELEESYKPLFKTELPVKVAIEPVKEMRSLSFNFPMPSLVEDWQLKPAQFVGHLLGHEGKGSLLSVLKDKGLAEGLSSGLVYDSRHGALFSVHIQLTEAGVAQEETVSNYFFQWLKLVKQNGLEAWRYNEVARMSEVDFQFMEEVNPMNYVRRLSTSLHYYPPEEILRGDFLFDDFDRERLAELTDHLTADNVAIILMAPGVETDRKTVLYDAPYRITQLEAADLAAGAPAAPLELPKENPYIPTELALINKAGDQSEPRRLDQAQSPTWYLGHNPYDTPKAYFQSRISVPGEVDAGRAAAREFVLALVMDQLSAEVYPAMLAGLHFSLSPWDQGYQLTVAGFNQKQPVLLERILHALENPNWDEDRVERVKATVLRRWRNVSKEWPLRQLFARFPPLVKEDWLPTEKAERLAQMKLDEIKAVHAAMVADVSGRFYGSGNLAKESMAGMVTQVRDALDFAEEEVPATVDILDLKPAESLFATHYYVDHDDSATLLYLQGSHDNLRERAMFALLEVMASAPFYSSLRTEKQLGYAVGSSISPLLRVPGLMFYVQSPRVDAAELREEIDGFFTGLEEKVENMSEADLERYRNSVLASIEQKPMNLNELAQRHLESLELGYESFDFREKLADAVKAVTLEEFKADFQRVLLGERTGLWILTSPDPDVGKGEAIPADYVEGEFSYSY